MKLIKNKKYLRQTFSWKVLVPQSTADFTSRVSKSYVPFTFKFPMVMNFVPILHRIRMAETYSTSPQNGIWPNLSMTRSKCSMSSTSKFVFFGPIQKQRWPPLSLHDWLRDFQLLLFNRLRIRIWQNLIFMKQVFKLYLLPSFWVFFCVCFFFRGGGGWAEFAENKYAVRVVNFTACRTCYNSQIGWLASRLCLISY